MGRHTSELQRRKKSVSLFFWYTRVFPGHLVNVGQLVSMEKTLMQSVCWCLWHNTLILSVLCCSMKLWRAKKRCLNVALVHSIYTMSVFWKNHPRIPNNSKMWPFLSQEFRVIKIQSVNFKVISFQTYGYRWFVGFLTIWSFLLNWGQLHTPLHHISPHYSDLGPAHLTSLWRWRPGSS